MWTEGLIYKIQCVGVEGKLLSLLKDFLNNRKQRVVLNGQTSTWTDVKAGVPQGSVLGPLFFLLYINDLPNDLVCNVKIFADDTSIFSTIHDSHVTTDQLEHDMHLIKQWASTWKMSFNPDSSKQAVKVVFSRKRENSDISVHFNNSLIPSSSVHKHLGMYLDEKLSYNDHVKEKLNKAYKGIGVIRKLSPYLSRQSLLTIYKMHVRPHLDYGDIIYDQPGNELFCQKIESVQYNAALAITGAIRGTSSEKIYHELGLESLRDRRWLRRMCFFFFSD